LTVLTSKNLSKDISISFMSAIMMKLYPMWPVCTESNTLWQVW